MSSQNPPFPIGSPQRIPVPVEPSDGMPAYRVITPRQAVRPALAGVPTESLDATSFQAISAVFIECTLASKKNIAKAPGCNPNPYYLNDWSSRLTLFLTELRPAFDDNSAVAGPGIPGVNSAAPQPFEIQIRMAVGEISETVFQAQITPNSYLDNGLLVALSGFPCSQWEVWGRIPNAGGTAFPMELRFQFLFDRIGDDLAGGPLVGRLVTLVEKIQYYP